MNRPSESECQATIVKAATILGYRVHHARPAQGRKGWRTPIIGHPGFCDLVIAGHGKCFFVELKRRPNRLDPAQQAWIDELEAAGMDVAVWWVPEQQQALVELLAEIAWRAA